MRPEAFADHYTQARMFLASQTQPEQNTSSPPWCSSSASARRRASATRCSSRLINIDRRARRPGLGRPRPDQRHRPGRRAWSRPRTMAPSPALSILLKAVPTLMGRKVGCWSPTGPTPPWWRPLRSAVEAAGARVPGRRAPTITGVTAERRVAAAGRSQGRRRAVRSCSMRWPSFPPPRGRPARPAGGGGRFPRDAFGHLKVIAYLPTAAPLLVKAGLSDANPDVDAGLISLTGSSPADFVEAAAQGRVWAREPMVRPLP